MKIIIVITITLFVNHPPMPPSSAKIEMYLTFSETDLNPQSSSNHYENAA